MRNTLPEVEGETTGKTQPVHPRCDWRSDRVSRASNAHGERSTYQCLTRRMLAGIQRKVVKQGKRNAVVRFILAKGDKEKIAGWRQDLARVLRVFNVRSIGPVWHPRT
jgi:hypothetical protein